MPRRNSCCRAALALAGLLVCLLRLGAQIPSVPEYRLGDKAAADVVTPVALMVFDPARTERLRAVEAGKVPPIFRFRASAGGRAEQELRGVFSAIRGSFLQGLQTHFDHSPPLLMSEVEQPRFGEFRRAFQERNPNFPLKPALAELWALGDPGEVVLDGLRARLRRLTTRYVRSDALPQAKTWLTGFVHLITVDQTNNAPGPGPVDVQGTTLAWSEFVSLTQLQQDAQNAGATEDGAALRFVTGFVRANCQFDEELTRQARARRIESINAADRYEAGQLVVKQGETINARIKLALDELRARTAMDRARDTVVRARAEAGTQAQAAERAVETTRRLNRWLIGALSLVGAICLGITGCWLKSRRAPVVLSQDASLAVVPLAGEDPPGAASWRERALVAEARAEKAAALLRARLASHLGRWMTQRLVQRLLAQQSEILTSHQRAEREVAELATRLENLHAPLEDRLCAYEKRIAELEAELAAQGEHNVELVKAKIESTRKKLENERSHELLKRN